MKFDLYKRLPDGPLQISTSPCLFEYRRMTKRDIEFLCEHADFLQDCEDMADRRHADDLGLSKEDWDLCPDEYEEYCYKGCYRETVRRKGHVVEFGVRGVYVCTGCDYAYSPIGNVSEVMGE